MSILPPPPHPRSWPPPPPPYPVQGAREELPAEDLEPYAPAADSDELYDFGEDDLETTPYHSDFPPPDLQEHQESWPVIPPAPVNYSSWPPTVVEARAPVVEDQLPASLREFMDSARVWFARAIWQARWLYRRWVASLSERWDRVDDQRKGWLRTKAPYVAILVVVATSMFAIGRTVESSAEQSATASGATPAVVRTDEASAPNQASIDRSEAAREGDPAPDGGSREIGLPAVPGVSPTPDKEAPILVSLAENLIAARRDAEAVPVLERALARNPKLTDDPAFLRVVKRAALSEDRIAAAATYALLVGPMGERGAEILYEISVSPASRSSVRERAAYFVYTKDFERKAPLPLYAAFKLVSASTCDAKKSLLPFAAEAGGRHALEYLRELEERKVCNLDDLDNCYSCMNADDELARTIAEIETRLGQ